MITGNYPYISKKNNLLMKEIVRDPIYFSDKIDLKYLILLKRMLHKDPNKRLSTEEIINYLIVK